MAAAVRRALTSLGPRRLGSAPASRSAAAAPVRRLPVAHISGGPASASAFASAPWRSRSCTVSLSPAASDLAEHADQHVLQSGLCTPNQEAPTMARSQRASTDEILQRLHKVPQQVNHIHFVATVTASTLPARCPCLSELYSRVCCQQSWGGSLGAHGCTQMLPGPHSPAPEAAPV